MERYRRPPYDCQHHSIPHLRCHRHRHHRDESVTSNHQRQRLMRLERCRQSWLDGMLSVGDSPRVASEHSAVSHQETRRHDHHHHHHSYCHHHVHHREHPKRHHLLTELDSCQQRFGRESSVGFIEALPSTTLLINSRRLLRWWKQLKKYAYRDIEKHMQPNDPVHSSIRDASFTISIDSSEETTQNAKKLWLLICRGLGSISYQRCCRYHHQKQSHSRPFLWETFALRKILHQECLHSINRNSTRTFWGYCILNVCIIPKIVKVLKAKRVFSQSRRTTATHVLTMSYVAMLCDALFLISLLTVNVHVLILRKLVAVAKFEKKQR